MSSLAPNDSKLLVQDVSDDGGPAERTRRFIAEVTEAEAAEFIGMSAAWLKKSRTRRFRGAIDAPPFIRAGIKRVVYRLEDLATWQERHLEHVGPSAADDEGNGPVIARDI